jgi:cytochrome P450
MTKLEKRDIFTDRDLLVDPYTYFRAVRNISPVFKLEDRGLMLVTGFEECREVLTKDELFSSITASAGPVMPLPFEPHGDDISALLDENRTKMPLHNMVTSLDGRLHDRERSLLNKLFVPSRLKANEEYMVALADQMSDQSIAKGQCELIGEIATPFVTLVVADLLGIPEDDRVRFCEALYDNPTLYDIEDPIGSMAGSNGYLEMGGVFAGYIEDRRANPREDILTQFAQSTYPDGTKPDTGTLAMIAMTLFGAGQDTSAKLLGNSVRYFSEDQQMQKLLREDPKLMANFIEEMMRLEGSTKITSRVALKKTKLGDVEVAAGQVLAVALAGANRDPRHFDNPEEFKLGRPKFMEHLGFGRGPHVCIGAPLARTEVRIFLNRLLAKTSSISLSDEHHGPKGQRKLSYEPSYGMRGLRELHVNFEPA